MEFSHKDEGTDNVSSIKKISKKDKEQDNGLLNTNLHIND